MTTDTWEAAIDRNGRREVVHRVSWREGGSDAVDELEGE